MASPPERRSYRQFCGVARALDVVGERWTLLVVRNLLLGPRRYTDLLRELPGITTNLLAKRLAELEAAGLVERHERPPPVAATVYRLTEPGAALEPVVMELGRWGGRLMAKPGADDTTNVGWALLALKRRYEGGVVATVALHVGPQRFELRFAERKLVVTEHDAPRADATVTCDVATFRRWYTGTPARELERAGKLRVEGDAAAWHRAAGAIAVAPLPRERALQ